MDQGTVKSDRQFNGIGALLHRVEFIPLATVAIFVLLISGSSLGLLPRDVVSNILDYVGALFR